MLYFEHAKLNKYNEGTSLSNKRKGGAKESPAAQFAAMPEHIKAICEVARLTLPFDDAYAYLETQMDKTQARSDRASEKGKDEKAGRYEDCLEQLTTFQSSLEELADQFQEFNEAILEEQYDDFQEHLGNYGVPEVSLMDADQICA